MQAGSKKSIGWPFKIEWLADNVNAKNSITLNQVD